MRSQSTRQAWVLGIGISALGLLCLLGGVTLLVWRITAPDEAIVMLPNMIATTEATPTPAVFGTPLAPPPAPDDPAQIVMLPVSEDATPTPSPTATTPTQPAPTHAMNTPTVAPNTATATRTATAPPPTPLPTHTAAAARPTLVAALDVWSTVPQRILIDHIGLDAPVVPVGQHTLTIGNQIVRQWNVPNRHAAGWHRDSAALGEPGNLVLNGHHNVNGEVFRHLITLEPGDVIALESVARRYRYVVVQTMTLPEQDQPLDVRQANARWILPTDDERVTLITCWPYYANTHRLVVVARPLEDVIPPAPIP
jgi:sortase A